MPRNSKENHTSTDGCFRFGEFDLYPGERQLCRGHRAVALPPKTFDALLLLVRHAEHLVRREQLIDALWPDTHVTDANLTNVIVALRKVLGHEAIQTVSKFGYRFCLPVLAEPGIRQATYATFLEGKALAGLRSLESMTKARELFTVCVAEDPTFAAAWAWLGRCARFLVKFNEGSPVSRDLPQAALQRALAVDPDLACAHHFYTQIQLDLGESRPAAVRLVQRLMARGEEPESFAGLVQALRYCGLLEESLAAHVRATVLDPAVATSVTHTHFLRGDYRSSIDTYVGTRYYLDAAAWAALGDGNRAAALLEERLKPGLLSPLMESLMRSLLAILEGRHDDAIATMTATSIEGEPEAVFYLARHHALAGASSDAVRLIQRARQEGLSSSTALGHDHAFRRLWKDASFLRERREAERLEQVTRRELENATGGRLNWLLTGATESRRP